MPKTTLRSASGFSHVLIPVIVILLISLVGTYTIVASHADSIGRKTKVTVCLSDNYINRITACRRITAYTKLTSVPSRPSASLLNKARKAIYQQWHICNKGRNISFDFYSKQGYLASQRNILFGPLTDNILNPQNYPNPDENAMAYTYTLWEHNAPSGYDYCTIYVNNDAITQEWSVKLPNGKYDYFDFLSPEYFCAVMVHEGGHLSGYYDVQGAYDYRTHTVDHSHSAEISNIMYKGFLAGQSTAASDACAR